MGEQLFPVVQVPEFTPENTEYDTRYRRSVKWNPVTGDFVKDSANRIVEAQTERYRCLAYPDSIGAEMERAMENEDEKIVESMVQRTITEALMVNPRTEEVRDFSFSWDGDTMHCSFSVRGTNLDEEITITI